ncbi:MAG: homoserine dehydrogenase, partial [Syntrophomonadaceae bacterium]|nr:homoserine dehydrogenase [Syntrophomonadaceae bacterium]
VSIAQVLQKTSQHDRAELILITHLVKEKDMQDALAVLNGMSIVDEINNVVRLEGNHR